MILSVKITFYGSFLPLSIKQYAELFLIQANHLIVGQKSGHLPPDESCTHMIKRSYIHRIQSRFRDNLQERIAF